MWRIGILLGLLVSCSWGLAADSYRFNHENVLGTSLELKLNAASEEAASKAERQVLAEIDRLASVYSTYDPNSEMRRWLDGDRGMQLASQELIELLIKCDQLHRTSDGAFDVRVGAALALWKQAAEADRDPTESQLSKALVATTVTAWKIQLGNDESARGSIERLTDAPLTFDGIAKGLIVDQACAVALKVPGVLGVMINIGGDLRVAGNLNETVMIADPMSPSKVLASVPLSERSITTSGNYERGFKVGNRWYSHIIDPRTARPAEHVISASVIANTTAVADGFSTAFCVLPVEQSLTICRRNPELACMLVTREGIVVSSENWPTKVRLASLVDEPKGQDPKIADQRLADSKDNSQTNAQWRQGAELQLEFEINRAGGNRYRRPYIAIWIEDKDQFPVRTLALWLKTDEPGPRWHRDLKRWYKQDSLRRLVDNTKLIGTISAATKPPGKYKVTWDGKDENEKLVSKGKYTLFIEAAREHGTYQLLSKEFIVGDEQLTVDLGQNAEIKSAKFVFVPRGTSK